MVSRKQRLSLRGLRTFCIAAEHNSFRTAADTLFVTASAVSHQIKSLEQELGKRLFDRPGRSIALTDAGKALYDDVRPLIEELDAVTLSHRCTGARLILRISVQPFFASELFIPSLNEFTRQHPDIDIKVDTSDESGEKHPTNADVSIRVFRNDPKSLSFHRLFSLKLVPAVSEDLCEKFRSEGTQVLSEFPRIVHESRPNAWREWENDSGIYLPAKSSVLRLGSMIAVARAAERGLGAALVPVQLSDSWFESGALVRLFSHELVTKDAYYFVYRPENADNEAVQKLRKWVLQRFADTG